MAVLEFKTLPDTSTPFTAETFNKMLQQLVDTIYPIGSIYISINATDPKNLFGGEWERIKDTFLLSAGDTYSAGSIGGEATHILTVNEMPSHGHNLFANSDVGVEAGNGYWNMPSGFEGTNYGSRVDIYKYNTGASNTGGGQAHNNMPPYLTVYMWKRTA
jgi:hypothetical protein